MYIYIYINYILNLNIQRYVTLVIIVNMHEDAELNANIVET